MKIDKVTLSDLSFLDGPDSVFSILNEYTTSREGSEALRRHILNPPVSYEKLIETQDAVKFWVSNHAHWTQKISNGTIVMVQKFFETNELALDKPNAINLLMADLFQKILKKDSNSFAVFSIKHLTAFLKGCHELVGLLNLDPPKLLATYLSDLKKMEQTLPIPEILATDEMTKNRVLVRLAYEARRQIRSTVLRMVDIYAQLDALQAMARTTVARNWVFPEIHPSEAVIFEFTDLVHPLLKHPKGYDFSLNQQHHFLFLTGANMSGKSTFLYALGISALMAHLGMGVPAQKMSISFLDGLITNMHIEDDVVLGESYFFAEVQRMKETALKLIEEKHLLVLMDELFKGTNGYDAFECTLAVVERLLKKENSMLALSTHLTDLYETLKDNEAVTFRHFHTEIDDQGGYRFTYELRDGVAKERIGFLVLKKEGVLSVLEGGAS